MANNNFWQKTISRALQVGLNVIFSYIYFTFLQRQNVIINPDIIFFSSKYLGRRIGAQLSIFAPCL